MTNGNSTRQSEQLEFSLLDNALDFLLSAAEAARRDECPRSLKEAVLHVVNGVELLIKARLVREHWALIFSNIDQASLLRLEKADFKSVDFREACERLEKIADITIEEEATRHIRGLRNLRNRLTHFTSTLNSQQAKSHIARAMTFCIEFCEQHDMTTKDVKDKFSQIHINLTEFKEFVDERMKNISVELSTMIVITCPECWQETLTIDYEDTECKFCRKKQSPQELASGHDEVVDCPECGEGSTFARIVYTDGSSDWMCYQCGEHSEDYYDCIRCGQMTYFSDGDDFQVCDDCWSDAMSRW